MRVIDTAIRDQTLMIHPTVNLKFTSPDGSWTVTHCNDDIEAMIPIKWQIPFGGGAGKTGNYTVTLNMCLDTIKELLPKYVQAKAKLSLFLSSSNYTAATSHAGVTIQPHVGRVRGVQRDMNNPHRLRLTIVDKLFDDNPAFPVETIADSYQNIHLEELESPHPIVYGLHHRPSYHTAVDSDVTTLLGPRNVSSENNFSSVWWNSALDGGSNVDVDEANIQSQASWLNAANSGNLVTIPVSLDNKNFRVRHYSPAPRLFGFDAVASYRFFSDIIDAASYMLILENNKGTITLTPEFNESPIVANDSFYLAQVLVPLQFRVEPRKIERISRVDMRVTLANVAMATSGTAQFGVYTDSNGTILLNQEIQNNTATLSADLNTSLTDASLAVSQNKPIYFAAIAQGHHAPTRVDPWTFRFATTLEANMKSEAYQKFSIFSPVVNSADIAVSTNPMGIMEDILANHVSVPFVASQNSASQALVDSFRFNCGFYEQENLNDIMQEFGEVSGTYLWAGDSGSVNFRTYQESGTVTVDRTLTASDFTNLDVNEQPIGTTLNGQQLYSKINGRYSYDFQKAKYGETKRAWPGSVALCNSLEASGVTKTWDKTTKYITDPNVASLWVGNLVRFHSQPGEFVSFEGGHNLMDIELADVIRLQHEVLVGSEGLYQVIQAQMNVLQGTVSFVAAKLVSTNPQVS